MRKLAFAARSVSSSSVLSNKSNGTSKIKPTSDTVKIKPSDAVKAAVEDEEKAVVATWPTPPGRFHIQLAKSDASKCRGSGFPIDMNTLRIGVMVPAGTGDFELTAWNHYDCFQQKILRMFPTCLTDTKQLSGFSKLAADDELELAVRLVVPGYKVSAAEQRAHAQAEKVISSVNAEATELSTEQLRDNVYENYTSEQLKAKKKWNRADLLQAVVDGRLYGKAPPCRTCGGGLMLHQAGLYVCFGWIDEFTKCTSTVAKVTPLPWVQAGKKIAPRLSTRQAVHVTRDPTVPYHRTDDFFHGLMFFPAGHLSDVAALKSLVTQNGGQWNDAATSGVSPHLQLGVAAADSPAVKKAAGGRAVVSPDWLVASSLLRRRIGIASGRPFFVVDGPEEHEHTRTRRLRVEEKKVQQANERAARPIDTPEGARVVQLKSGSKCPVDSDCPDAASYIVVEGKGTTPYSATLSSTDIATGKNSFYILQLLEGPTKNNYLLFRKWGRVGDASKNDQSLQSVGSLSVGTSRFEALFTEKTGNNFWDATAGRFVKQTGYLNYLPVDYTVSQEDEAKAKKAAAAAAKNTGKDDASHTAGVGASSLDSPTEELVRWLFDAQAMQSSMVTMEIDTHKLPLGNLSTAAIDQGNAALRQLSVLLQSAGAATPKKKAASTSKGQAGPTPKQAATTTSLTGVDNAALRQKIISLSNRFYTYVPHVINDSASALLDTLDKVAEKTRVLDDLSDIVLTKKIIASTTTQSMSILPLYQSLKTDIAEVDPKGSEGTLINTYFRNTHGSTHSQFAFSQIWKLDRHGESARFKPWVDKQTTRHLLWHGSRFTNWVRILSQGLRIAPPEAPVTGYMFGKGVYFADMISKSANYCHVDATGGLIALAEVATGSPLVRYHGDHITSLPSGHHSTFAQGRSEPDPKGLVTLPDGVMVPAGKPRVSPDLQATSLLYNEYIVYDVSQIRLRYLLRIAPK